MKNKIILVVLALLMVFVIAAPAVNALSWSFPITEVKLGYIDTTPKDYPIYLNIINKDGQFIHMYDPETLVPNGWIMSNHEIIPFIDIVDYWLEYVGLDKNYNLECFGIEEVSLCIENKDVATSDQLECKDFYAIVITLKEKVEEKVTAPLATIPEPTVTEAPKEIEASQSAAAPVQIIQLPATGEKDYNAITFVSIGILLMGALLIIKKY